MTCCKRPKLVIIKTSDKVGPTGPTGPIGPIGATGSTGNDGPIGPMGSTGATGPSGTPGTPGQTGAPGPIGPTGLPGSPGAPGATGPEGPIGPTGPGFECEVITMTAAPGDLIPLIEATPPNTNKCITFENFCNQCIPSCKVVKRQLRFIFNESSDEVAAQVSPDPQFFCC
jgi:hypothetical protein